MSVFDPLAISLILAYNALVAQKKKEEVSTISIPKKESPIVPIVTPTLSFIEPTKVPEKIETLPSPTPTPTFSVEQVSYDLVKLESDKLDQTINTQTIVEPSPTIQLSSSVTPSIEVAEIVATTPEPTVIKNETTEPIVEPVVHISAPPPPPLAPHGIVSGKVSPR